MKGATNFVVIVLITVLRACQCKGLTPSSGHGENLQSSGRNPASSWQLTTRPRFPPKIPFKSPQFLKKRTLKLPDSKSRTPQREKRAKKNANSNKRRRPPFSDLLRNFQPTTVQSKLQDYEFGDLTRWLLQEQTKARSRKRAAPSMVLARPEWYSTKQQKQHETKEEDDITPGAMVEDLTTKTSTIGAFFVSLWRSLRSVLLVYVIKWIVALKIETFVLRRLPIAVLVELLQLCAEQETRPQIVRVVGIELDKRLKLSLTGDEDYEFGDITKRAVAGFTGQSTYRFGDITKSILVNAKTKTDQVARLSQLDFELNELKRYIALEKPSRQWPFFRRFSSRK